MITTIPALVVQLDGSDLPIPAMASIAAVRVAQSTNRPDQIEMVLVDPPADFFDEELVGQTLSIARAEDELFGGAVSAVTANHAADGIVTVRVRGYGPGADLCAGTRTQTFEELSAVHIVESLLGSTGIAVDVHAETPVRGHETQFDETDMQFIHRILDEEGLFLTWRDGRAVVAAPDSPVDVHVLQYGVDLLEFELIVNQRAASGGIRAVGWDPVTGLTHVAESAGARAADTGLIGEDVSTIAGRAGASPFLDSMAQAYLDRHAAGTVEVKGTVAGTPSLRAGATLWIESTTRPTSAIAHNVVHTLDGTGFLTSFDSRCEPPSPRPRPTQPVTPGSVVDVEDPERKGRIKVSLPAFDGITSAWLPVVSPGAAGSSGIVALPTIGDVVAVLVIDGPSRAVVLGGMSHEYDFEPVADGVSAVYRVLTPGGHCVTLDDTTGVVRVEHAEGSSIELGPEMFSVHSVTDLTIEAPGRAMTIGAASIDFRRLA